MSGNVKTRQSLPLELYRPIVKSVAAPADLYRLLLASRFLRDEAERVLYHKIHIQKHQIDNRLQLFNHLATCDRVASYVRILSIGALKTDTKSFHSLVSANYWQALNKALCALKNLRNLSLQTYTLHDSGAREFADFCLLSGCTFQVHTLSLGGVDERDLTALVKQKVAQHLRLQGYKMGTFYADPFTNVSTLLLLGSWEGLPKLLSSGNIKALCVRPSAIVPSTIYTSIQSLELRDCAAEYVPDISSPFPALRYLRLHLRVSLPSFQTPLLEPFRQIFEMLKQLPRLQKLHFMGSDSRLRMLKPEMSFEGIVSLRVFVVEIQDHCHVQWVRGGLDKVNVEYDPSEWSEVHG